MPITETTATYGPESWQEFTSGTVLIAVSEAGLALEVEGQLIELSSRESLDRLRAMLSDPVVLAALS